MATTQKFSLGENIDGALDGTILTLKIDLAKRLGPSKQGKSTLVASSHGNQSVGPGLFLGLNCYTK